MKKTNFNDLPSKYKDVLSVLREGSDNAISSADIEKVTGVSTRNVSLITADLKKGGK